MGIALLKMSAYDAALSKYQVPYAHHGYGYPPPVAPPAPIVPAAPKAFLSGKVAEDLRAEETYLENRRKLQEDLRKAETNEGAAVDNRVNDERVFEVRSAEAHEQSRRAANAEAIAARATEELRIREAEAKAANAAAAETKALADRATEANRMATEARNTEVSAAEEKSRLAREAESILSKSVADHESAASVLSNCQNVSANTPLPGAYCSGPYQRQYGYMGPGGAPAAGPGPAYAAGPGPAYGGGGYRGYGY